MKRTGTALLLALLAAAAGGEDLPALVRGLASPDWQERERCEARLTEIGLPAQRLLEAASRDPDEERSWRARKILGVITRTRLSLHVEDAQGRAAPSLPLQISLLRTDGGGAQAIPAEGTTDAKGVFDLPMTLEAGSYQLHLAAPGFLPFRMEPLLLAGGGRALAVRLERGASVSGILRFSDGTPAKGVAIGLHPCMEPAQIHRYAEIGNRREAVADAEGRFAFEPVPEGEYRVLVEAFVGTLKARALLRRSLMLGEGQWIADLALDLPEDPAASPGFLREAVLKGRCLDAAGRPLPGRLVLFLDGVAGWPEHTAEAKADAQGRFEVLVPPGRHWLSAALDRRAPATVGPVALAPGVNPEVLLTLTEGAALEGRVLDPSGEPVPLAEIAHYHPGRLEAGTPETSMARFVQADKQGRFAIPHAMPGDWELRATAEGAGLGDPAALTVEEGRPRTLTLAVPPAAVVRGRVLSADGTPCERAALTARAEAWDARAGDPWESYAGADASSGPEGLFEMALPFGGRWRIVAEREGFEPAASPAFWARPGRATEGVDIRMPPRRPGRLKVRAVDAAGRAVSGAQVQVLALHPLRAPVRTDARGEALLERLPPASYSVLAAKAGLAPGLDHAQLDEDGEASVTCTLREGSRLSGRLLDAAGKPLAAHAVWAWRADFSLRHVEEQVGAMAWEAMTDAEGRYTLAHLPAGRLKVMPAPDGRAAAIWSGTVPPEDRPVEGVDFRLGDGVPFAVKVTDARGRPVANAAVEAYPEGFLTTPYSVDLYAVAFTDAKGLARLEGLPAAERVDLLVSHPEQAWAFLKGRAVPAAGEGSVEVALEEGSRCEGQAVFKPPATLGPALRDDVFVLALGPGAAKTRLREDGRFSFPRLLPGDYEVFLTAGQRRLAGVPLAVEAGKTASCRIEVLRPLPAGTGELSP